MTVALAQSHDGPALQRVLARFPAAKRVGEEYVVCCPVHGDNNPSLYIRQGNEGVLMVCRSAGCSPKDIVATVGLTMSDLFDQAPRHQITWPVTASYEYRAAAGERTFRVIRRDDPCSTEKTFTQERFENGKWIGGKGCMRDVPRVLFRFPELLRAPTEVVWIPEGEQCALAMTALGLVATTNSGGAGKWLPSHTAGLQGRHAVILPDNDPPGEAHAALVAKALDGVAASVKVLRLPGLARKGDVSDWIAAGGIADELRALADATPVVSADCAAPRVTSSTRVVNMADVVPEEINWLWQGWIPRAKITILDGDPGLGKSTMLVDLTARITSGRPMPGATVGAEPAAVVVIAHEDGLADTLRPRLDAAGANASLVDAIDSIGGRMPSIPGDLDEIEKVLTDRRAAMLILDPLFAYLDSQRDSYKDHDIRSALAPLCAMAERTGTAIVAVRHLRKSGGVSALHRGGGSVGIIGVARSGLLVARDPGDDDVRILASVKSNVASPPPSLRWRFAGGSPPRIEWIGTSGLTADHLVNVAVEDSEERSAMDDAGTFLREALSAGPASAKDILRQAREAGIAEKTLRRAAKRIGARARKVGSAWQWVPTEDTAETKMATEPRARAGGRKCWPSSSSWGDNSAEGQAPAEDGQDGHHTPPREGVANLAVVPPGDSWVEDKFDPRYVHPRRRAGRSPNGEVSHG